MAGTGGISKSSVWRRIVRTSRDAPQALGGRRFDEVNILAVWIDGIVVDDHHILAAVGVAAGGRKHVHQAGLSENAWVISDLILDQVQHPNNRGRTP